MCILDSLSQFFHHLCLPHTEVTCNDVLTCLTYEP